MLILQGVRQTLKLCPISPQVLLTIFHDCLFVLTFGINYPGNTLHHMFSQLFSSKEHCTRTKTSNTTNYYLKIVKWLPWSLDLLGGFVQSAVYVVVVLDYVTECEIIRFSVQGLEMRLREKSVPLERAFKDIIDVRQKISMLNGPIGWILS